MEKNLEERIEKQRKVESIMKEINDFCEKSDKKLTKEKFESKVLQLSNAYFSLLFVMRIGVYADIASHAKVIIDSNDPEYNFLFAFYFPDLTNVKNHGQVIIDSKNLKFNYDFAKDVKGADIQAHGQVITNSKNLYWNYHFAKNVKGADIKTHGQVILDGKDLKYIKMFAKDLKGIDKIEFNNYIKNIELEMFENRINEGFKKLTR